MQLELADLIEEERAFLGHLEQARLGGIGAAEGSFFVAEQFAFYQILGQSGAVDVDPGATSSAGRFVNRASDEFLARSGLSGNQDGFSVTRDAIDQSHEFVHHRAGQNELCAIDLADVNG